MRRQFIFPLTGLTCLFVLAGCIGGGFSNSGYAPRSAEASHRRVIVRPPLDSQARPIPGEQRSYGTTVPYPEDEIRRGRLDGQTAGDVRQQTLEERYIAPARDAAGRITDSANDIYADTASQASDAEQRARQDVASIQRNAREPLLGAGNTLAKDDLLGNWQLAYGGASCLIGFSLTQWQGGNRAFTRNCKSSTLKSVSSWRLQGNGLVLRNNKGETIATLQRSGDTRFSGSTGSGRAIRFWR